MQLIHSPMRARTIKIAALLFANIAALALSNALPVQSFPQWETLRLVDGDPMMYDLNSIESAPNGIKKVDIYSPSLKYARVMYISCSRWRWSFAGTSELGMIPPGTFIEALAYKVCGKS